MNTLLESLAPVAETLVPALLNSLWQGTILAAVVWGLLKFTRRVNAATTGLVWWTVLLALLVLPLLNLGRSADAPRPSDAEANATPSLLVRHEASETRLPESATTPAPLPATGVEAHAAGLEVADQPASRAAELASVPASPEAGALDGNEQAGELAPAVPISTQVSAEIPPVPGRAMSGAPARHIEITSGPWAVALLLAWMLCSVVLLARLAMGWRQLRRLKQAARTLANDDSPALTRRFDILKAQLTVKRAVKLGVSNRIHTPLAAGLRHPMVLLPANLTDQLTEAELDAVIVHELAHLRRWDDWMNLLQQVVQAVLCLNPVVWFTGRQIALHREIACDDWVIAATGRSKAYASCLTRLMELARPPRLSLPAPGAWMTRGQLSRRVVALLDKRRNVTTRGSLAWTGLSVGMIALLVLISIQWGPAMVLAQPARLTEISPATARIVQNTTRADAPSTVETPQSAGKPPLLQFRRIHSDYQKLLLGYPHSPYDEVQTDKNGRTLQGRGFAIPAGYEVMEFSETTDGKSRPVLVESYRSDQRYSQIGRHVIDAKAAKNPVTGNHEIRFNLDPEGAKLFEEFTRANWHREIAILVDGRLVSAPRVQSPIAGGVGTISESFTEAEAIEVARKLLVDVRTQNVNSAPPPPGQLPVSPEENARTIFIEKIKLAAETAKGLRIKVQNGEASKAELEKANAEIVALESQFAEHRHAESQRKAKQDRAEAQTREAGSAVPATVLPKTAETQPNAPSLSVKEKEHDLILEEIALVEQILKSAERLYSTGRGTQGDVLKAKRDLVGLKRQLAVLEDEIAREAKSAAAAQQNFQQRLQTIVERASEPRTEEERAQAARLKAEQDKAAAEEKQRKAEMLALLLNTVESDSDAKVRLTAIQAIGALNLAESREPLITLLGETKDKTVRDALVKELARLPGEDVSRVLLQEFEAAPETDARARVDLFRYLATRSDDVARDAVRRLAQEDSDPTVRRMAIGALTSSTVAGSQAAAPGHPQPPLPPVPIEAVLAQPAQGRLPATPTRSSLDEAARQAEQDKTAAQEKQRKLELLPALLEVAQKDADPQVRVSAVHALGGLGLDESIDSLLALAKGDAHADVRKAAFERISNFQDSSSTKALLELYRTFPDTAMRPLIVKSFVERQSTYITNASGLVQVSGFNQFTPTNVVPLLLEIISDERERSLRLTAVQRLASVPAQAGTRALIQAYNASEDTEVKQEIVRSLGDRRPDDLARDKLVSISKSDADASCRKAAVEALGSGPRWGVQVPGYPPTRMQGFQPAPQPQPPVPVRIVQ
jgi:beta-lactamase regulating signal transducer with metallopeptidase domain